MSPTGTTAAIMTMAAGMVPDATAVMADGDQLNSNYYFSLCLPSVFQVRDSTRHPNCFWSPFNPLLDLLDPQF